jgi:hypothetical protein
MQIYAIKIFKTSKIQISTSNPKTITMFACYATRHITLMSDTIVYVVN